MNESLVAGDVDDVVAVVGREPAGVAGGSPGRSAGSVQTFSLAGSITRQPPSISAQGTGLGLTSM